MRFRQSSQACRFLGCATRPRWLTMIRTSITALDCCVFTRVAIFQPLSARLSFEKDPPLRLLRPPPIPVPNNFCSPPLRPDSLPILLQRPLFLITTMWSSSKPHISLRSTATPPEPPFSFFVSRFLYPLGLCSISCHFDRPLVLPETSSPSVTRQQDTKQEALTFSSPIAFRCDIPGSQ